MATASRLPLEAVRPLPVEESSLVQAFASFTEAAASLERSYLQLQGEVARLRHELENTNRDLASSLDENHRMRLHLNRILEALPCGVLVIEAGGSVSLCNAETQRLLGVSPRQTLPGVIRDVLDRTPAGSSELEWRFDQESSWIMARRAQLTAEEGGSAIFILQDVSGRKRLEQQHETLRRRQALAEMSAVLAHEIRNPLGSLELFAGLLAESGLAAEERGWVGQLQAGLRTMAATVNNVLQFHSQPKAGFASLDLGQLLRSLEPFLQPLAERAQVRIELVPSLDGVFIEADRHRVQQVVLNLALNSFHFMSGAGMSGKRVLRIAVQTADEKRKNTVRLQISDTGPGIAPGNLDRIFEPGFTTRPASPGLGLAVCRTIMEQHHGSIRVDSRPGGGARFTLEFPRTGVTV